jgi:hypothetical protein
VIKPASQRRGCLWGVSTAMAVGMLGHLGVRGIDRVMEKVYP